MAKLSLWIIPTLFSMAMLLGWPQITYAFEDYKWLTFATWQAQDAFIDFFTLLWLAILIICMLVTAVKSKGR